MRILIADHETPSREKLRLILNRFGDVEVVDDGQKALVLAADAMRRGSPFGLVVLEAQLPAMEGVEVLARIRAEEAALGLGNGRRASVLMVSAQTSKELVLSSAQAGCDGYLAKPLDPATIGAKLARLGIRPRPAAPAVPAEPDVRTENKPLDLLRHASNYLARAEVRLPTLPRVFAKFKELTRTGASFRLISGLLKNDLAISAELIRLSNSAFYRGVVENKTLEQAVSRLGFAATEQVIADICGRKLAAMSIPRFRRPVVRLLKHSSACAFACEAIASLKRLQPAVDPFTLGLLHDIGKLALLQVFAELEQRGKLHPDVPMARLLAAVEEHHTMFGARLLEKWKYSEGYVQAVLNHHNIERLETIGEPLCLVYLGNLVTARLEFSSDGGTGHPAGEPPPALSEELHLDESEMEAVCRTTAERMQEIIELF